MARICEANRTRCTITDKFNQQIGRIMFELGEIRRTREALENAITEPCVNEAPRNCGCDGCSGTCDGTCEDTCKNGCYGCGNMSDNKVG